jgi:hypothetical protein
MRMALAVWALAGVAAADVTVYRVVDQQGRVSYSDRPPADGTAEAVTVQAADPTPSTEDAARQAQMRELTDRLREERLARETARAEAGAASVPYALPAEPRYESSVDENWLPIYYPGYAPRPPWYRPPPVLRPPLAPQPNPQSLSPRGLQQRLRNAR